MNRKALKALLYIFKGFKNKRAFKVPRRAENMLLRTSLKILICKVS